MTITWLRQPALLLLGFLAAPFLSAQGAVYATWNGGKIDESEFKKLTALMLLSRGTAFNQLPPEQQQRARYEIVESSAVARIVAAAASKSGVAVSAQDLDTDYKNFVESSGGEAAAAKRLADAGMTRDALMQERRTTWLMQNYFAKIVGEPKVSPEEIQKAYVLLKKNSPNQLNVPDRVMVAHIVIGTKPGMSAAEIAAAEKQAQTVRALAAKPGADFGALAKQYSSDVESRKNNGNVAIPFSRNMIQSKPQLKEFIETAFKLKPGELSPVLKVEAAGYVIMKTVKVIPAHAVTLQEATPKLTAMLRNEKGQNAAAAEARRLSEAANLQMKIPQPPPASGPAPASAGSAPSGK
jgi:parvulin-like peptidyl-prolyl isomerase